MAALVDSGQTASYTCCLPCEKMAVNYCKEGRWKEEDLRPEITCTCWSSSPVWGICLHIQALPDGLVATVAIQQTTRFLVRELSPSLLHKPAINYLLTFPTGPHTRLLNIILNIFIQLRLRTLDFIIELSRFYCGFAKLFGRSFLIVQLCRSGLCMRHYTNVFD